MSCSLILFLFLFLLFFLLLLISISHILLFVLIYPLLLLPLPFSPSSSSLALHLSHFPRFLLGSPLPPLIPRFPSTSSSRPVCSSVQNISPRSTTCPPFPLLFPLIKFISLLHLQFPPSPLIPPPISNHFSSLSISHFFSPSLSFALSALHNNHKIRIEDAATAVRERIKRTLGFSSVEFLRPYNFSEMFWRFPKCDRILGH